LMQSEVLVGDHIHFHRGHFSVEARRERGVSVSLPGWCSVSATRGVPAPSPSIRAPLFIDSGISRVAASTRDALTMRNAKGPEPKQRTR
jgi:hypothetical protein